MTHANRRTTREVFEDHLHLRKSGATADDIARNYADDLVVISGTGVHHGRDGVRETARILNDYLPDAEFDYHTTLVEGEYAFLEWTGRSRKGVEVYDGADSFVIREGRIVFQSIHYTVIGDDPGERPASGSR